MSDLDDVKLLLSSTIYLIELLVDDTATLVEMVLVPRTSEGYAQEIQTFRRAESHLFLPLKNCV